MYKIDRESADMVERARDDRNGGTKDRRIVKTLQLIKKSYVESARSTPQDKITVKQICDLANINRGTFYYHYLDIPDLKDKLEKQAAEIIAASICSKYSFDGKNTPLVDDLFECIDNHRDDAELLFGSIADSNSGDGLVILHDLIMDTALPHWKANSNVPDAYLSIIFDYTMSGIFHLLSVWLHERTNLPAEEFKVLYSDLINTGISRYIYV